MAVVPTDAPLPPPPKMDPIPTAPRTIRRVAFATDDMDPAPPRPRLQLFDAPLFFSFGTRVRTAFPPADALQLADNFFIAGEDTWGQSDGATNGNIPPAHADAPSAVDSSLETIAATY